MFVNIDYNKKPQKAKLHLAKPNKQIISIITEKFADSVSLKLGNINELQFSIPYSVDNEKNKHVEIIKEKMLIRLTLGTYQEWYAVETIEENGDDSNTFVVSAFSLGYELRRKRVSQILEEAINAKELLTKLLENSVWNIGEIDPIFEAMFRTFEISDSNILDSIIQAGETYGALIVWDTLNRKISFEDVKKNGRFRGMTVDYGKFLRSIKKTRTTDEMVTRLHIEGGEGLTVHAVNPTGMGYIEDFSYFMHPFQRDANGNVIKSSDFMSDDLCIAIEEHRKKVSRYTPDINSIMDSKISKESELFKIELLLATATLELDNILAFLDTAQATGDTLLITQRKQERDEKTNKIDVLEVQKNKLLGEIKTLQSQVELMQEGISYDSNFTTDVLDELDSYIIESIWLDDRYTDVQELYDDGLKRFEELRQPKVVIDVTIDNLLNIIEEQYYWDKLVLGDLIKVKYPQMNIEYMAKIIEINYNLEAGEASLVIANNTDLLNETEKLVQLLYSNSSASSLIQNNKYKWDKINAVEKELNAIITQEWDANKNKITAGVNNNIEIGNRGIIIQNPDFPLEVIIIQSGIIALSQDGGETWKTAVKPDGIIAERLIGQIITGQELIITNSVNSFTLDNNGATFDVGSFKVRASSGGGNLVDRWQTFANFVEEYTDDNIITPYEKKMLKIKWEEMSRRFVINNTKISNYYPSSTNLQFVNDYYNSYDSLYEYLFTTLHGDKPLLSDSNLTYTTRIVSADFNSVFRVYDSCLVELESQLDIEARRLTELALQNSQDAIDDIREVMDDVVYKIEIHSSNGFTFRNGDISTVLTAKIYRGMDDITSLIPVSGFIWSKKDKDGVLDVAWSNAHKSIGKQIAIDRNDIYQKATFQCDINIIK